jgi:hypothetical protein
MLKENNIAKYIKNEKDISRCKMSILESISELSISKKRILGMEASFIEFPFEEMDFSNIDEAERAMLLYRSYRSLFNKKYSVCSSSKVAFEEDKSFRVSSLRSLVFNLYKKILFLNKSSKEFMSSKAEEVNLVQDKMFFDELTDYLSLKGKRDDVYISNLYKRKIDYLTSVEPITIAKKRARVQAILVSLGMFISSRLSKVGLRGTYKHITSSEGELGRVSAILNDEFYSDVIRLNEEVNCIVEDIDFNLFKNYNLAIEHLTCCLEGTMGYNKYLKKLYKLENVFSIREDNVFPIFKNNLKIDSFMVTNTRGGHGTASGRYAMVLPLSRVGNEKIYPFYYNIISDNCDISSLFRNKFFNTNCSDLDNNNRYYKSMMLRESSELEMLAGASPELGSILNKVGASKALSCNGECVKNLLNSKEKNGNFIPIDINNSCIYISKTRTDGEMIHSAAKIANIRVDNFKADYFGIAFSYNDIIVDRIKNRKDKIFSL